LSPGADVDRLTLDPQYMPCRYWKSPHTVDATLWYFHALASYLDATADHALLGELYPTLRGIIDWHRRGTRCSIHVDPDDGLLYAGEPGVQLTWMDAKVGDWIVTPRTGKPVEINALWHYALLHGEFGCALCTTRARRWITSRTRAAWRQPLRPHSGSKQAVTPRRRGCDLPDQINGGKWAICRLRDPNPRPQRLGRAAVFWPNQLCRAWARSS
jgi:hypothetical protein